MTPQDIELAARRRMNAVSSKFWSQEEIIENHLFFACQELAEKTYCIENRYTDTSVASQKEYAKPTRMITARRLEYDGKKLRLTTLEELDTIDLDTSTTVTGTPEYYYFWDDVFMLYPAPDTSGDTIKVYTYDYPSQTTKTSTLEIPAQYHHHLVTGVLAKMVEKEIYHPNTERFSRDWKEAIEEVKRSEMRRKRRDEMMVVRREEDMELSRLGYI